MKNLHGMSSVNRIRFVDDLFLARPSFIRQILELFEKEAIGQTFRWDATGRINVLSKLDDDVLERLFAVGCREVALGIESGNDRVLAHIDKHTSGSMTVEVVRRLLQVGISVKGYYILGLPAETESELQETMGQVAQLWDIADRSSGDFRASAFEFRPYPGSPEWNRLRSGGYSEVNMLNYQHVDLTANGADESMRQRDEFNFTTNVQYGAVAPDKVRKYLAELVKEQHRRMKR